MTQIQQLYSDNEALNILAQQGIDANHQFVPVGDHLSRNDLSSAKTISPPSAQCRELLVQCITQNVRYTLNGTTPTATLGFRIVAGEAPYIIPISETTVIKVIEEAATAVFQFQWGI